MDVTIVQTGPVALAGGNEFRAGSRAADRRLIELAGGPESPIAIVPTAAARQRPELAAENGRRHLAGIGARRVEAVMVVDRSSAANPRLVAALAAARLIYLTGGDPRHLHDVLAGSPAWQGILDALSSGAVLAGSSAGAMVLGAARPPGDRWGGVGLGLLPDTIVQPHYRPAPSGRPQSPEHVTVLGIAEETTFLRQGPGWTNLGSGSVWVLRGAGPSLEIPPGGRWEPE